METVIVTLLVITWAFNGLWVYIASVFSSRFDHSVFSWRGLFWLLVSILWPLAAAIYLTHLYYIGRRHRRRVRAAPSPV